MPFPTVQISRALTNISIATIIDQKMFIAPQVFPFVGVDRQTDRYHVWDVGDLLRTMAERLQGDQVAPTRHTRLSDDSYTCETWGVREALDPETRANQDEAVELEEQYAVNVTQDMLIRNEIEWFTEHFAAGKWDTDRTGVDSSTPGANQFERFDRAGSKLFEPLREGIRAAELLTGGSYRCTDLVMGAEVWDVVAEHAEALDKIKHTQTGIVQTSLMASALDVKRVHVSGVGYNSAQQGAADAITRIAGKGILGIYRPASPGRRIPSAGYSFGWKLYGGNRFGTAVRRYKVAERNDTEYIEGRFSNDHKCVSSALGVFFATAVN